MKKVVSIIVPTYNVEKYIKRCIDSILNQSYKKLELIIVDDGSKDNTLGILKSYKKKDKRITVITEENSGPAIARNNGINHSSGEYIMFIDSDDYIDNDYVETYINAMDGNDYDVIMGGYKKITGNKVNFVRKLNNGLFSKYITPAAYVKLYRSSFLKDNRIIFLDTKSSEDIYFTCSVIKNNAKIKCIDNTGYYYYFNPNSISNTIHKGFNDNVDILGLMNKINYKSIENVELHHYFIIRYIIWYLLYSGKQVSSKDFYAHYKKYFSWLENNISDFESNKYIKFNGPSGEIKSIGHIIFIFMILHKLNLVKIFSVLYCKGGKNG